MRAMLVQSAHKVPQVPWGKCVSIGGKGRDGVRHDLICAALYGMVLKMMMMMMKMRVKLALINVLKSTFSPMNVSSITMRGLCCVATL